MKQSALRVLVVASILLLVLAAPASAAAPEAILVTNIRAGADDGFDLLPGFQAAQLGTSLIFAADSTVSGVEIWRSNGSAAGTQLITALQDSSGLPATEFTAFGEAVYFVAPRSVQGTPVTELWKTDGTASGTVAVYPANPLGGLVGAERLTVAGGRLYFIGRYTGGTPSLWSSDGTTGGTIKLLDDIAPRAYAEQNGKLFFITAPVSGVELWTSDGTPGGTTRLKDADGESILATPATLVSTGETLYFLAYRAPSGQPVTTELWASDGTAPGTRRVKEFTSSQVQQQELVVIGDKAYFAVSDGTSGVELWTSDGTTGGTERVADINSGPGSSFPTSLAAAGTTLLFFATDSVSGIELWAHDTVGGTTALVKDLTPGSASSSSGPILPLGGKGRALVVAEAAGAGSEPWITDGTAAGTVLVRDIAQGSADSVPDGPTILGSSVLFTASDSTNGRELWRIAAIVEREDLTPRSYLPFLRGGAGA
jgi:ELWxxDGT repeat protein